jgi:hypothetical protein
MTPEAFIALWKDNKLTERGGAQAHFDDLCDLLGVAKTGEQSINITLDTPIVEHFKALAGERLEADLRAA